MTVQEFFSQLSAAQFLPELQGAKATYRYDIRGAGRWRVTVEEGAVRVDEGDGDADCSLTCDASDFLDVVLGRRNAVTALMQGRLVYRGPIHHLLTQATLFRLVMARAGRTMQAPPEVHP